jgi:hypothetical protein
MATVDKNFKVKNGLVVEGTTATVAGSDVITEDIITSGTQTNITVTYDAVNKQVNFVAENGVADSTTDDLEEGTTNLYYTNTRVKNVIDAAITNGTQTNITVTYDDATNALSFTSENGVSDSDTDDLEEGSVNLYFTDQRAIDAVINGAVDTDDIEEGSTNLYFTEQRAIDAVGGSATNQNTPNSVVKRDANGDFEAGEITAALVGNVTGQVSDISNHDTDELSEGTTNLYFTDARAKDAVASDISTAVSDHSDLDTGVHGVTGDVVGTTDTQTISNKTLGGDLNANSFTITNLPEPTNPGDAAPKSYVDEVAQGLVAKPAAEAATTTNLSGTYSNGTNGVDATLNLGPSATLSIDGWTTWELEDGVLVKDQTTASENGRYFVFQIGDEDTDWILKRCIYCDESDELPGSYVFIKHGDTQEATGWVATVDNASTFVIGTDDVDWVQFSGAGTYLAGNGLELNGQTFSIDTDVTVDVTSAQTLTNKSIDGGDNTLTNIDNSSLVNDSVTVNGSSVALGESIDIDTDAVEEGSSNLYFTDARAQSAVALDIADAIAEGDATATPTYEAIDVNSVAKQVAATVSGIEDTATVAYSFSSNEYRSAKFLVKISSGSHTEVSEVLVTLDTSDNIAITEYAIVGTNGSLATVSATTDGTDVDLIVTPGNDSTIMVYGTLLV